MRAAGIYQQGELAGILEEINKGHYRFVYDQRYHGEPISLALPIRERPYEFDDFPSVFEGLLPEGMQLEALLRQQKVDRKDMFQQLLIIGQDVIGSLRLRRLPESVPHYLRTARAGFDLFSARFKAAASESEVAFATRIHSRRAAARRPSPVSERCPFRVCN